MIFQLDLCLFRKERRLVITQKHSELSHPACLCSCVRHRWPCSVKWAFINRTDIFPLRGPTSDQRHHTNTQGPITVFSHKTPPPIGPTWQHHHGNQSVKDLFAFPTSKSFVSVLGLNSVQQTAFAFNLLCDSNQARETYHVPDVTVDVHSLFWFTFLEQWHGSKSSRVLCACRQVSRQGASHWICVIIWETQWGQLPWTPVEYL